MVKTVELLTLDEFQRLPDEDPYKLELVRGRVVWTLTTAP